jgi:hypothetical protein
MISYRTSNLFDSLNKQISPFKLGDVFTVKENKNVTLNSGFTVYSSGEYIYSHNANGKLVFQICRNYKDYGLVDLSEVNMFFNKIGHAELYGFKVGDQISAGQKTASIDGLYIARIGFTIDSGPKFTARAYLSDTKDSEVPVHGWDLKDVKR